MHQNIFGISPCEPIVEYSRAVRVGSCIHVTRTTATDANGERVGIAAAYA